MKQAVHEADFCVVGGGLAGLCAAVSAARNGARAVLIHDRPVLGGNASSEIRMWACGAYGENNRETGIIEEIELENMYRNPAKNYSLWDSVLYEKARYQENLTLLLNCTCSGLVMDGNRIESVRAWQLTTETWHTVSAGYFADCSGDGILAPLSGAEFRLGREAASEFGESIEPEKADRKTMGMSCLLQAREMPTPQKFIPPAWANKYSSDDDLANRGHKISKDQNFWWIELGGEHDSIHDSESIRDELLKVVFGVWDHIKNSGGHEAENWAVDWVGFLPGKRESRRYVGDHILTQNDIQSGGRFDDAAAYGGWPLDDHHPAGFNHPGNPNVSLTVPSPFGIPYRCLYSKNIDNLFFAGRNISATHAGMSSTRVMLTCAIMGQAAGTAAAIALREGLSPRGVLEQKIADLQQCLMEDDCYIPRHKRRVSELSLRAELSASDGDPEPLRNGIDRPVGNEDNGWTGSPGSWVEYSLGGVHFINDVRLVFDSDLNRKAKNSLSNYPLSGEASGVPASMVSKFRIEVMDGTGSWKVAQSVENNYQRLAIVKLATDAAAVRFIPEQTWGSAQFHLFSFEIR